MDFATIIFLSKHVRRLASNPQAGGPGSCIYDPQWQGGPVIPLGIGLPFQPLIGLEGLLWRYSNPPPHGVIRNIVLYTLSFTPITVAAWSKAWTLFARASTATLGLNPTWGMDVCVVLCVEVAALRRADPLSKESYRLCRRTRNWKSGQGPTKGCRAIHRYSDLYTSRCETIRQMILNWTLSTNPPWLFQ
jgi:hypothetical protein